MRLVKAMPAALLAAAAVFATFGTPAEAASNTDLATIAGITCGVANVQASAEGMGYPANSAVHVQEIVTLNHMQESVDRWSLVTTPGGRWVAPPRSVVGSGGGLYEVDVTVTDENGTRLGQANASCTL